MLNRSRNLLTRIFSSTKKVTFTIALLAVVALVQNASVSSHRTHVESSERTDETGVQLHNDPVSLERRNSAIASASWISVATAMPQGCTPPTGVIISEVRLRGPAGANDEFIEFYNTNGSSVTICTADGSSGWALVSSEGTTRFVIPSGTVIPAQGHFLAAGSSYSLSGYAAADLSYSLNIPDNIGIALFNTSNPANFSTSTRLDAVGFTSDANALYREGTGLTPLATANDEFTLLRSLATGGVPLDTNNNAADFQYLSATAATGAKLGAPGPENFWSPIQRNNQFPANLLDATVGSTVAPNRVRDLTSDPANNSTYGTLSIRRRIVNNSGAPVTRLRFRVVNVTTYPVPSGTADVRMRSSSAFVQMNINDANTCAASGTPATPPCSVTVEGTLLEQPPNQTLGGGFNATLSVALPQPLAPSASINVQWLLGLEQTGFFQFWVNVEALTENGANVIDPANRTGGGDEDPFSRNFNWGIPVLQLPGRAGLDLGLSLAYNSLVWTRTGSFISFDDDHGFPSPGFRLGFPVIQPYYNVQLGKNGYLFLASDGTRIELRQVGTSSLYQAVDSSYLLLDNSTMKLRTADGTQMSYVWQGSDFQCTEIKDRNGNYITINYTSFGRMDTIVDTVNRTIKFNYDASDTLTSITQTWTVNGSNVTHTWASFQYRSPNLTVNTNFSGLTNVGPQNGSTLKVLSRVTLADNSRFEFDYTSWGQIWKISEFANDGQTLLNYRSYNLPLDNTNAETDCPRFTQRRDWAKYWNRDTSGTEQEAITSFIEPASTSWTMPDGTPKSGTLAQVTLPDGTYHKLYSHSSGWDKGLPQLTETYDSSPTLQRQVTTAWTQDDTALPVPLNPRVTETNTYDPAGNRKRTRTTYQQFTLSDGTSCSLPQDVFEYQGNATTVLRSTRTTYNMDSAYTSRRIIGLVSDQSVYAGDVTVGGTLMSKVSYQYDEGGSIQGTDAPVQHDNTNFSANFVVGRANVSGVKRHDVNNTLQFTATSRKYNTAGAIVSATDASNHLAQVSYNDSFSDGISRNTLAYPTTITDPDGYTSTARYNFDFGGITYKQTPQPNTTSNLPGPQQTFTYDSIGRLERTTNVVNNAYSRYIYGPNYIEAWSTVNTVADEAHGLQILDGAGRTIATAANHPGSVGGFSGQIIVYDAMGRAVKQSNPTETSISIPQPAALINPFAWTPTGDDATAGWIYTQQTHDWRGRPLITTNQNATTKTATYSGCGCAGGEVVTLTDEGTFSGSATKRRQRKIYSDVLGRIVKTEILNWEAGSVYSTTIHTYNARHQVTQIREYAGAEGSPTFQDTTLAYDGYGRLQSRHVPQQNSGASTVWTYNADDTISTITDARGATTTFGYAGTNRHLVKTISHVVSGSPTINVSFEYDAAGNRMSMTDSLGSVSYMHDLLSQLTSETRTFSIGSFTINYSYNLSSQLTGLTDPFGASFSYTRDTQGRLKSLTGSPYAGFTNYVNDVEYRAWGAPKSVAYNGSSSTIAFNGRLQPTQFRLTANSNGASIMRENYSYFADGRLAALTDLDDTPGTNPPVTLRFLSRAFSYDHVGRTTGGSGTGAGSMPGVPFSQAYGYDQFDNMTSRSGSYYNYTFSQPSNDTATYVNNRRTNWSYNAEGQVLATPLTSTDAPRTMTYDAAGNMVSSVETGQFSTVTYSASYDGNGELVFESSTTSPGTSESSYIVRSTVLGGEILTRVDQFGNKKITHVPAEGLVFATQRSSGAPGPFVMLTQRNPLNITETNKAVYDPLGNYHPFQAHGDPRPPAGSYTSASTGGLSASQANPYSYAVGCLIDGLPTTCNRVVRAINNGQAKKLVVDGRQNPNVALANIGFFLVEYPVNAPRPNRPKWRPRRPNPSPGNRDPFNIGKNEGLRWALALVAFEQGPQNPQRPAPTPTPPPCSVAIPTDSNDRAVLAMLLGEASTPGENTWDMDQSGIAAYRNPSGTLTEDNVFHEMFFMVAVVDKRLRDWGAAEGYRNWADVVSDTTPRTQFEGYGNGQQILRNLGPDGGNQCNRARIAMSAIRSYHQTPWNTPFYYWKGIKQWSNRHQAVFIRARNGAYRLANTDFQIRE